ncbi:MAG: succinate dehydrogenase/fumarate reductase iron-sulfur subunit [Ignavibacteria bacterium]|nr:succinate dehydrogenase/fumarate reductase iron-sulfur subunit [Ignavibacteria bacterium]MBT8382812.1 succinate dehydrogenase/fumarate reductase iron-sulfur subunit [Ignavibacteria bacterium]MBT8392699.1 succinate dehydrogenase/fumarate reductase iron-sulfur subunit [Ignavibacteria bacterium]NNJ52521.1 succinate dehydrogenase/fumarate reductase iron-sulfur subunit [Ignavibacteriaceae bacterium]NNL21966.1 succinate dehydrogenase/fumarate reductase iron-sulfur subunit [Ignavibacteriaceae bacte
MEEKNLKLKLKIWRQKNSKSVGSFVDYDVQVSPDASFLEMLDELNNSLEANGEEPIHFESDCREGICGTCGLVINGHPHGPLQKIATCQLHMRNFKDGETLWVEPFRAKAFPVIKDLMVDRSGFDKILEAGGYVSVNTGGAPDANLIPIPKDIASEAFDAAACIGCGACVAACKNASAMLFTSAKVSQYALLPQGQQERYRRVQKMIAVMDELGFGSCTNTYACEAECPKGISVTNIARMNRDFASAKFKSKEEVEV